MAGFTASLGQSCLGFYRLLTHSFGVAVAGTCVPVGAADATAHAHWVPCLAAYPS